MPKRIWNEWKLRRLLRENCRLIELEKLRPLLRDGQGTLIEEWDTKGTCRVWWTMDDLASQEPPMDLRDRYHAIFSRDNSTACERARAFNTLCLSKYIARDDGKASLTTIPARHAKSGKLARDFPRVRSVIAIPPPFWWQENRVA